MEKTEKNVELLTKIWILYFWLKFEPFFRHKKCHNKNISQNEGSHTPMSSLFHNFQSIGILTWKCLIFDIFLDK